MLLGPHQVSAIWQTALPNEAKELKIPAEKQATCNACPMIASAGYRPDYRCCTYIPRVPNYLLGRAKRQVVAAARDAGYLLPEGLLPSPRHWAGFLADCGEGLYGKSERTLCPFLQRQTGLCGIYEFRNAVCSTYFCKHDHGGAGEQFWELLQTTMVQTEIALGQWALRQAGYDVEAMIARIDAWAPKIARASDAKTSTWSQAARRAIWGKEWFGRELELYAACAKAIAIAEKAGGEEALWNLANQTPILEPDRFELAAQTLVPPEHQGEIEDDFSDEAREKALPKDLWRDVVRAHKKLWALPPKDGTVRLSPRARLLLGVREDTARPDAVVRLARADGTAIRWHQALAPNERQALQLFATPRRANPKLYARVRGILADDPETFMAEWLGKKILVQD